MGFRVLGFWCLVWGFGFSKGLPEQGSGCLRGLERVLRVKPGAFRLGGFGNPKP